MAFERARQGAVDLIRGDDPLTADCVNGVSRLLEECLLAGQPRAVLDLARVALIDSAALEMLLNYQESFKQRGGALKLAAPTPLCRDILMATGVDRHFEIFGEAVSAVGSFAQ
jgi:anti-sigma B factor antagonist